MDYKVYNAQGEHVAGDPMLDDVLKASALLVDGWVADANGEVVYVSPGRQKVLDTEAEGASDDE